MPTARKALPDRKSTRLNSSHLVISYAVFCLKKKKINNKAITYWTYVTLISHRLTSRPLYVYFVVCHDLVVLYRVLLSSFFFCFFFFNDTATTEIYTLSLHDALPICCRCPCRVGRRARASRC